MCECSENTLTPSASSLGIPDNLLESYTAKQLQSLVLLLFWSKGSGDGLPYGLL